MGLKVPTYERQVNTQASMVGTPTLSVPRTVQPIEADFGGQVQQANERLGETVSKLGNLLADRVVERQEIDNKTKVQKAEETFLSARDNLLRNKDTGYLNRHLSNAIGSSDDYTVQISKIKKDLDGTLDNDSQRSMFSKIATGHTQDGLNAVSSHEAGQQHDYDLESLQTNLAAKVSSAANISDSQALQRIIGETNSIQSGKLNLMGYSKADIDLKNQTVASKIIESSIIGNLDNPNGASIARNLLDTNKEYILGSQYKDLDKAIKGKEFEVKRQDLWFNKYSAYKLNDEMPDTARIEKEVYAQQDLTPEDKDKLNSYMKGKASEAESNFKQTEAANDRTFFNDLATLKRQRGSYDDALKLPSKYGRDSYDIATKESAVKKMYSGPDASDQATYIALWERVKSNQATRKDIDNAFNKNLISISDYEGLRKDYFNNTQTIEEKANWDRIKLLADENFHSLRKKEKNQYLYEVKQSTIGKTPDEAFKIAKDKLTVIDPPGLFNKNPQWKIDLENRDTQLMLQAQGKEDAKNKNYDVWSKVNTDIGDKAVNSIFEGLLLKGKKQVGVQDLENFSKDFGGMENIKAGTPVNNAIQLLIQRGAPVVKENIAAVLNKYPDGKLPNYSNARGPYGN